MKLPLLPRQSEEEAREILRDAGFKWFMNAAGYIPGKVDGQPPSSRYDIRERYFRNVNNPRWAYRIARWIIQNGGTEQEAATAIAIRKNQLK